MLPTPSTSHVSFNTIYEPSEDSFLFLDTLSSPSETSFLKAHFSRPSPTPLVTELGTGSGVILAFLAAHARHIFGRDDVLCLGVDVNLNACKAAGETVRKALSESSLEGLGNGRGMERQGRFLGCVNSDLTSSLRPREVDVLVFNPPYVPTDSLPLASPSTSTGEQADRKDTFEEDSAMLSLSYAGGRDGMEVTDRLLDQLPEVLSRRGVAYVLFCRQNRPDEVKRRIKDWNGGVWEGTGRKRKWTWAAETVGESGKRAGWEKLEIVRIWRQIVDAIHE